MTRQDFQLIADVLADSKAHWNVVELMAERLGRTNSRFDTDRFLTACQPKKG